jgi:hypothetical protein
MAWSDPVRLTKTSADLTPATGARTTRFCRPRNAFAKRSCGPCTSAKTFAKPVTAPFVLRAFDGSQSLNGREKFVFSRIVNVRKMSRFHAAFPPLSKVPKRLRASRRTGCPAGRDDCTGSFICLNARELLHKANIIALAPFVQQGVAVEGEPIAGRANELDRQGRSRIADGRQLALRLLFHAGLCVDGPRRRRCKKSK